MKSWNIKKYVSSRRNIIKGKGKYVNIAEIKFVSTIVSPKKHVYYKRKQEERNGGRTK